MSVRILVSWRPPDGLMADEYRVYQRAAGQDDGWVLEGSTVATQWEARVPASWQAREYAVAAVVGGVEMPLDDWSTATIQPSATAALDVPDDVSDFTVVQVDGHIEARWTPIDDPRLSYYEIRKGSTAGAARHVAKVRAPADFARFGWEGTGSTTYLIAAFHESGRRSANWASATLTVEEDGNYVVQGSHDESGGGFAGTKSGTEVNGGNLEPELFTSVYTNYTDVYTDYTHPGWMPLVPDGTYVTDAQDAGAVVEEKVEVTLAISLVDIETDYTDWTIDLHPLPTDSDSPEIDDPGPLAEYMGDGTLTNGIPVVVEIDTTPDDPASSPTWDGWRTWVPGSIYRYRGVRLRLRWDIKIPWLYPRVTSFSWRRLRLNRKDEGVVTVSGTGGTTITFRSGFFTEAPTVSLTAVAAGGAVIATIVSGSVDANDCQCQIFDDANNELSSGDVHWSAFGV